jgi:pyruvate-formate lyase-activating enzyme
VSDFEVLEPAIDPNNRITFLLDWELTMKCNLDCSYCGSSSDLYGGHDNSTKHPHVSDCLRALDFMFKYADLYMSTKPKGLRYVVLNVYGGEALHHPDIVKILSSIQSTYQPYADRWKLTVTTTTNAIVSNKKLQNIIPYIDEFTVSYHSESTDKQKEQFRNNLLSIAAAGKRQKCVVLMHHNSELFEHAKNLIEWLGQNNIKYIPKQLDGISGINNHKIYNSTQVKWFSGIYQSKTFGTSLNLLEDQADSELDTVGRACCGGRSLCKDTDYKSRNFFVSNKFPDWYCSVNHFFVFIKQLTGDVFTNKDCKMNFNGEMGPIGNLNDTAKILTDLSDQIKNQTLPIIQCKKSKCMCGLCAPKAKNLDTYKSIMKKYQKL